MDTNPVLLMIEDDVLISKYGPHIADKFGFDYLLAETYEQAVQRIDELSTQCSKDIIVVLDGEFPSEDNFDAPGLILLQRGLITPDKHLLVCHSGSDTINEQMPKAFGNDNRILSKSGKPNGFLEGVKKYNKLYD